MVPRPWTSPGVKNLTGLGWSPTRCSISTSPPEELVQRTFATRIASLDYWESGMDLGLSREMFDSFMKYPDRHAVRPSAICKAPTALPLFVRPAAPGGSCQRPSCARKSAPCWRASKTLWQTQQTRQNTSVGPWTWAHRKILSGVFKNSLECIGTRQAQHQAPARRRCRRGAHRPLCPRRGG